ncbi:MAG: tripartite tricarboxylate transporter substrate binding protein [Betaproteobacteria bacterium]
MRTRLFGAVTLLAATALPLTAFAQTYPDKPIRVIVPVPAGGTPDVVARLVMPGLSNLLGQQLVVDNRGGAGGLIGAELAAKAVPDGYTIFFSSPGSLTILPHLQKQVNYDTLRDFVPVSLVCIGPFLLITHPSVPAKSVQELLALAKAQPGKLNYASAGNGSANHLAMELFKSLAGVNITHIPYKGAPQAVTDLIGGSVNLMFNSIPPAIQHIKAGRLRLLAVSTAKRSPQLPDVPTVSEAGVPGYESITWFGLLVPAKTPPAIVARLHKELVKVVHAPEMKAQLEHLGYDALGGTPAEFAKFIRAESEKYAKVVKLSGAKVD